MQYMQGNMLHSLSVQKFLLAIDRWLKIIIILGEFFQQLSYTVSIAGPHMKCYIATVHTIYASIYKQQRLPIIMLLQCQVLGDVESSAR